MHILNFYVGIRGRRCIRTIFLKSLKSGYEDIKIDTGCCQKMRQSFMKHASNLDQIKSFLSKWHEYKKKVQKN